MKAFAGLLAVLLMLSCTSLAQTPQAQPTTPGDQTAAAPQTPQTRPTDATQQTASAPQTVPVQQTDPAQTQQPAAESPKPDAAAASSTPTRESAASAASTETASVSATASATETATPSTTAATPSTDAAASADVAPSAGPTVSTEPAFAPGMKLFVAPMMNGFQQRVAYSITKKKVPVVLVTDRAQADFVLSGIADVHKRNFFTGFVLSTNGYGSVWVEDAHTGKQVFLYKFTRVDANTTVDQSYQLWANSVANRLRKTLEKK